MRCKAAAARSEVPVDDDDNAAAVERMVPALLATDFSTLSTLARNAAIAASMAARRRCNSAIEARCSVERRRSVMSSCVETRPPPGTSLRRDRDKAAVGGFDDLAHGRALSRSRRTPAT